MRLDLFLKTGRLCPRRAIAQQLCDAGFVLLNGCAAKSGHKIKAGDEVTIRRRDRQLVLRVLRVPTTRSVSRRDAHRMYEIVSETEV